MTDKPSEHKLLQQPTLRDLASHLGLSVSTVSRALAGKPQISQRTIDRVRARARDIGYQPNIQARSLRNSQSTTLGLAVPAITNPYFAELAQAVQERAEGYGMTVMLGNTREDPEALSQIIEDFTQLRVRGLIVVPHEDLADTIARLSIPVVLIDRSLPTVTGLPCIQSDPVPGIREALQHLHHEGHTTIGYLAGPDNTSTGRERKEAFLSVASGRITPVIADGGYTLREGIQATTALLDGASPTAIIAGDSMMTIGAIETCLSRGLIIGEDISLIGFDDYPLFSLQQHPITIIDQHVCQMAHRAVDVLLGQDAAEPAAPIPPIPTELVYRDSVRRLHVSRQH